MKLSAVVAMSCVAVTTAQKNKNKRPFSFHENRVNAAQGENRNVFKVYKSIIFQPVISTRYSKKYSHFELNKGPLRVLMEISIWLNCIFKQCFRLLVKNGKKHQDKCSTMVAIVSWLQDDQVLANHLMLLMSKFDLFRLHWLDITEVDPM